MSLGRKCVYENAERFERTWAIKAKIEAAIVAVVKSWGVTQKAAGDRLGISSAETGKLMRGVLSPSLERLLIIAGIAGVKVSIELEVDHEQE